MDAAWGPAATIWIQHQLATRAFEKTAAALRAAEVPVVPVKGILLARWLYRDVAERPMQDVDLLVASSHWDAARLAVARLGPTLYESRELRELTVDVNGVHVELHGEVGRRELTDLTVADLLARCTTDTSLFGFAIERLDAVDHTLFVAVNAIKDGLARTPPHVATDLERLLPHVDPAALVERARQASFTMGLYCTAEWLVHARGFSAWSEVLERLSPPRRPLYARAFRRFRTSRHANWGIAVALGCWANDRLDCRVRALTRLVRRNAVKLIGRMPP